MFMLEYSSSNPTKGTFFFTYILSSSYSQPYFGQFFYLVRRYLEKKLYKLYKKEAFQALILHVHVARDLIRRKYFGIFDFRFRLGDTANFVSYGEYWQHKSPELSMLKYSSSNPTQDTIFFNTIR